MKRIIKHLVIYALVMLLSFSAVACSTELTETASSNTLSSATSLDTTIQDFYDLVKATQDLLDTVADAIYSHWYDAIYKDKYNEDINLAIAMAMSENSLAISTIKANDSTITELYKKARDSKHSEIVREVMTAYSDYYEFVINVSGSFKTFSEDKESLKKELASALKSLKFEI